jgi:hypothetical protein
MNGRVYDPVIGRFLSTDPLVSVAGSSQSLNPYSYVQNRPLALTDPTGLAPGKAGGTILPISGGCGTSAKRFCAGDTGDAGNPAGTIAWQAWVAATANFGGQLMDPIGLSLLTTPLEVNPTAGGTIPARTPSATSPASNDEIPEIVVTVNRNGPGMTIAWPLQGQIVGWLQPALGAFSTTAGWGEGLLREVAVLGKNGAFDSAYIPGAIAPTSAAMTQATGAVSKMALSGAEALGTASLVVDGGFLISDTLAGHAEAAAYKGTDMLIMTGFMGAALGTGGASLIPAALFMGAGGSANLLSPPRNAPSTFIPPYPY